MLTPRPWIAGVVLTLAMLAGRGPCAGADEIAEGRTYFMRYCASCHGVEGDGHGFVGPALAHPPSDLRHLGERNEVTLHGDLRERHDVLAERIARFIDGREMLTAHGTREMPVWGERFDDVQAGGAPRERLVRERINTMVAYLFSIQAKGEP